MRLSTVNQRLSPQPSLAGKVLVAWKNDQSYVYGNNGQPDFPDPEIPVSSDPERP
jgi:hypothetical protein